MYCKSNTQRRCFKKDVMIAPNLNQILFRQSLSSYLSHNIPCVIILTINGTFGIIQVISTYSYSQIHPIIKVERNIEVILIHPTSFT